MEFKKEFEAYQLLLEKNLDKYIPDEDKYPQIIYEAMRYSVFAGGKRLRPVLMLSTAEAFCGDIENVLPFACAVEMIHTYSLIHDDLPAMDNDDYRRGKLTSHKVFGEDIAILAGDALLSLAFEIMVNACINGNDKRALFAMREIAYASGTNGMVSGQVSDVISNNKSIDEDTLMFIYKNKTAALISGSISAGACLAGADEKKITLLKNAGEKIGIAFQIKDDILDVVGEKSIIGKMPGSDEKNGKPTYTALYGLKNAEAYAEELLSEASDIISCAVNDSAFLCSFIAYLAARKK